MCLMKIISACNISNNSKLTTVDNLKPGLLREPTIIQLVVSTNLRNIQCSSSYYRQLYKWMSNKISFSSGQPYLHEITVLITIHWYIIF